MANANGPGLISLRNGRTTQGHAEQGEGCVVVTGSRPSPRRRTDPRDRARYVAIRQDERFAVLKGKSRRLIVLIVSVFLGWYFLYVVAAAFARDLMAYRLVGNVNVALVFGVLQFASAFVLAWRYTRYARQVLDPLAAQIVADAEERVGEAVRRRTGASPAPTVSPAESPAPATDGVRPYLGPTPPDGMAPPAGSPPPYARGRRPYLGPTPPDGTVPPPDPAAPPGAVSPPRPTPWPEAAGRPWTGGAR
ncbi:DUF485 domain-containing protein [Actinoallomurus sp. CA-150999]|uniref:DUF485 domain-containing protein n=1 Tax=Actinoallomurus sp. CA-150999 TaxID=3239887 RepID=UPI003D933FA0